MTLVELQNILGKQIADLTDEREKYCAQQKRCSTCEAERFGIHCLQYLTAKFLISQNVSIGERSDDDAD